MKHVVDNLTHQHRELTKVTMNLVPLLDAEKLAVDAAEVRRSLRVLTGILNVHLSMEDRSFYPFLLSHRNPELRKLAEQFLVERDELKIGYLKYVARWSDGRAIERDAAAFVDETRAMLYRLGKRMLQEDQQFHPRIVREWESGTG